MADEVVAGIIYVPLGTADLMAEPAALDFLRLAEILVFRQRLEAAEPFVVAPEPVLGVVLRLRIVFRVLEAQEPSVEIADGRPCRPMSEELCGMVLDGDIRRVRFGIFRPLRVGFLLRRVEIDGIVGVAGTEQLAAIPAADDDRRVVPDRMVQLAISEGALT